jgi:hypothetical protein
MGANIAANGSREQMSYTIDCLRSHTCFTRWPLSFVLHLWSIAGRVDGRQHCCNIPFTFSLSSPAGRCPACCTAFPILQVEQMGANIAANGSREQMSYTIDCLRSHAPAALELLADCVINPALLPHEIEEQKARMQLLLSLPDVQLTLLSEVRV